ncbi:flagellar biosynthetic protein FliR [Planctomycetota bacterium]
MIERLVGFFLVLTRLSAFFLILPVFSWRTVPVRLRMASIVMLSIFFALGTGFVPVGGGLSPLRIILLLAQEATYGLALGLIIYILFAAVRCAARIIERQMGMAMAEVMDPLTGERTQPLAGLLEMIFILFFLAANGHHLLLLYIARSYETFPVGTVPSIAVMTEGVAKASSILFSASLRLAAPMLAVFLVMLVVLAIMSRLVPEMNILFVSMPIRVGLGLMMTVLFLPYLREYLTEFTQWMGKLLPI